MRHRGAALLVLAGTVLAGLVLCSDPASSVGGTLDATYGTSGAARVDFGGTGSTDVVQDLAVQTDGKVVAVGSTSTGFAVLRLTSAGSPDATYGTNGSVTGTAMSARGVALQADGKAVVVGTSGSGAMVLARFTTAGVLDSSFGVGGTATVSTTGSGAGGRDVAIGTDGTVVALGVDGGTLTVARFTSAGVLDATFGTGGRATTTATPGPGDRVAVQPDGRVVFTGHSGSGGGLFRLTVAGAVDTFGTSGAAVTANHVLRAVAVQSSGKLVAAGDFGSADVKALVVRRTADGALDSGYGTGGVASFAVPGAATASVRGLFGQTDGSVLVTGRLNDASRASVLFLARLTPAGVLDTTFASGGIATFSTAGSLATANANAVAADANGRFLVGGSVVGDHASFTADDDFLVLRVAGPTTSTSTSSTAPQDADAGATVTSDGGALPTPDNPVVVSLTTPVAGKVGITKNAGTVAGSRSLGGAVITAPSASAAAPLRITFDVDVSALPASLPLQSIVVTRDSAVAADCASTTAATPDPCVLSRTRTGHTASIQVLSTHASSWTLTRPILQRLFGDDRILSSIAISQATWSAARASTVVLARSDDFADALAAIPLAVAKKGPLLLTGRQALDDRVLAELTRVLPVGKVVYVLGGPNALSPGVVDRVERWGYTVVRLGGDTRYDTAVAVATKGLGSPSIAVETTGLSFADALTAGTAAASAGGAVLLTAGTQLPKATADYLKSPHTRIAIGGPAAAADKGASSIVGDDRYETAVLTAKAFFGTDVASIGVASGATFADALSGGVHAGMLGAPLVLLPPSRPLPGVVRIYLRDLPSPPSAYVYGGTTAFGADVAAALQTALGG